MRNKKGIAFLILVGVLLLPGIGAADTFSGSFDWFADGTDSGHTYTNISDGNVTNFVYSFTVPVAFSPPAEQILTASISLTHKEQTQNELWYMYGGTSALLGQLSDSHSGWVTDTFTVPSSLFPAVPTDSWSFAVKLKETTNGTDQIKLDVSTLSGTYTPQSTGDDPTGVPEPASLLLLGSGLVGLVVVRRRPSR